MQARVSRKLHDRLETCRRHPGYRMEGASASLRALSPPCRSGKKTVVVTTAIAREMIGFIWAIARQVGPQSA